MNKPLAGLISFPRVPSLFFLLFTTAQIRIYVAAPLHWRRGPHCQPRPKPTGCYHVGSLRQPSSCQQPARISIVASREHLPWVVVTSLVEIRCIYIPNRSYPSYPILRMRPAGSHNFAVGSWSFPSRSGSAGNAELVPNRHSGLHGGSERFTVLLGSPRGRERRDQPRWRSKFFTGRRGPPRLVGRELYDTNHGEEASSEFALSFFAYLTFRLGNWGSGARIAWSPAMVHRAFPGRCRRGFGVGRKTHGHRWSSDERARLKQGNASPGLIQRRRSRIVGPLSRVIY
jgi:hypothetical protein